MKQDTASPKSSAAAPALSSPAGKASAVAIAVLAVAIVAGVGGRLWLLTIAPRWAYLTDHLDNIQMGRGAAGVQDPAVIVEIERRKAARRGQPPTQEDFAQLRGTGVSHSFNLFHVYDLPPQRLPIVWGDDYGWGTRSEPVLFPRVAMRQVNYPPLGLTLFWAQSGLLEAVAPDKPANTFTSRLIMSLASILAEALSAWAAFLIVRRLVGASAGLLAAAVCWILPPLAMDSCFWGQTDGWFIAPALFTIYVMIRGGRWAWVTAGILSAVTVLLKPQGIFLGPIVLMASLLMPTEGEGPAAFVILKRIGQAAGAGLAAFFVLGLPWLMGCGTTWIQLAYIENVGLYVETTMKAFNVWYLDALLHDTDLTEVLNRNDTILGITKTAWGQLLVAASLVVLAALYYRKRLRGAQAVVLFSGVWLWSTFLWPTGVHERYILYGIPVLAIAAFAMKRLWPAVLALVVVGSFELCHTVWLPTAYMSSQPVPVKGPDGKVTYQTQERPADRMQAGTLVYALQVENVFNYYQDQARQAGQRPPSRAEVLRLFQEQGRRDLRAYDQARQRTLSLEWLLTLGCLLGYAWAFAAPFVKRGASQAEEAPNSKLPPAGKKIPDGKRR